MQISRQDDHPSLLDVVSSDFEISRGSSLPLGATVSRRGVNFALFSKHASSVSLVLFAKGATKPLAIFPLDTRFNRTGDIWHAFVRGLDTGIEYGYLVDGDSREQNPLGRFDPTVLLVDPYARSLTGGEVWGKDAMQWSGKLLVHRKAHLVDNEFDWGFDQPLNIPMSDTIIYELHVRGFTRHDSSDTSLPGTYAGLTEKIPYLKDLGVTAVELLPINEFSETDTNRINPFTGERLLNFWGYHSINFFAPKASYSSDLSPGGEVREFKSMVKAFHEAGIEVILDMVFNHTAEGDERGQTFSFRGLDNSIYYLLDQETGEYLNYSGCGNTLNCNHPVVRELILDCLRYWVTEMHVDGFRFDLASILGRGRDGSVLANPPLLERIAADPILAATKLIAEAWDAAGLYQVGSFPSWGRWAEWNGRYRDDVRRFVKGVPGRAGQTVQRLLGSPDIYAGSGREAHHSVNFVTCHDGFTLRDLTSYESKHNDANGEDNRDGTNDNCSWNCGSEGDTDDPAIESLRKRQMRNFAAVLLLSRGVPMILAGDEFGRTQRGNNNAYCQDNEISWLDWRMLETNSDLFRFFKLLLVFRKAHPSLRQNGSSDGEDAYPVIWHGARPESPDWSDDSHSVVMQISETKPDDEPPTEIYIALNAFCEPLTLELPSLGHNRTWRRILDTERVSPDDIYLEGQAPLVKDQTAYRIGAHSVVVLVSR